MNVNGRDVTTVTGSVTVTGGATEAKQDSQITQETAIATSLAIMDDWDSSDRAKVIDPASTPSFLLCDGTDELLISSSARRLLFADLFSLNDAPVYAKYYDKATAPDENDTPIFVVGCPANATAANGAGSNKPIPPGGIALTNGLGIRVVKGLANNSDTAVDASEVLSNTIYSTLS